MRRIFLFFFFFVRHVLSRLLWPFAPFMKAPPVLASEHEWFGWWPWPTAPTRQHTSTIADASASARLPWPYGGSHQQVRGCACYLLQQELFAFFFSFLTMNKHSVTTFSVIYVLFILLHEIDINAVAVLSSASHTPTRTHIQTCFRLFCSFVCSDVCAVCDRLSKAGCRLSVGVSWRTAEQSAP